MQPFRVEEGGTKREDGSRFALLRRFLLVNVQMLSLIELDVRPVLFGGDLAHDANRLATVELVRSVDVSFPLQVCCSALGNEHPQIFVVAKVLFRVEVDDRAMLRFLRRLDFKHDLDRLPDVLAGGLGFNARRRFSCILTGRRNEEQTGGESRDKIQHGGSPGDDIDSIVT